MYPASTSSNIHLVLICIATVRATPTKSAILLIFIDEDFTIITALVAVVRFGVQLCIHDVVVDVLHHFQHSRNVVAEVRGFNVTDTQLLLWTISYTMKGVLSFLCLDAWNSDKLCPTLLAYSFEHSCSKSAFDSLYTFPFGLGTVFLSVHR